jgi:hypothetical protein
MLEVASDLSPNMIRLAVYTVVVTITVTAAAVRAIRRRGAVKELVSTGRFQRLGNELVDGLYLRKTSFAWRELRIFNSLKGSIRGVDVAVFDVAFTETDRRGEPRTTQTVVGFRREGPLACIDAPSTHQNAFVYEIAGDWLIYFCLGKQVPVEQLESWCEQVYDHAAKEIESQGLTPKITQ